MQIKISAILNLNFPLYHFDIHYLDTYYTLFGYTVPAAKYILNVKFLKYKSFEHYS